MLVIWRCKDYLSSAYMSFHLSSRAVPWFWNAQPVLSIANIHSFFMAQLKFHAPRKPASPTAKCHLSLSDHIFFLPVLFFRVFSAWSFVLGC